MFRSKALKAYKRFKNFEEFANKISKLIFLYAPSPSPPFLAPSSIVVVVRLKVWLKFKYTALESLYQLT